MILTKTQAEAIANVMAQLNNIGGRLNCQFDTFNIVEFEDGEIVINGNSDREMYASQADFLTAYSL